MKFLPVLLAFLPLLAWPASFDCQKARSATEKMVCANPELSKLDAQLTQTYRGALKTLTLQVKENQIASDAPAKLIEEQKNWLTFVRNLCTGIPCLREVYQLRIEMLARDPSPSSDIYPANFINKQTISYPRNFADEIISFNQSIIDDSKTANKDAKMGNLIGFNESIISKDDPGKILGCNKLIYVSGGGTAPNAYTAAGICMFQKGKMRTWVRICSNEVIGNYVIQATHEINDSYTALVDFANNQCQVGG